MPRPLSSRARAFVFGSFLLAAGCDDDAERVPDGGADSGLEADSGSDAGDAAAGDAAAATLEIRGGLVDQTTGQPVIGATVFVADAPGVISDTDGRFRVAGVTAPYDVAIRVSGGNDVVVFEGLTRTEPLLAVDGRLPKRTADVSGHALLQADAIATDRLSCFLSGGASLGGFTRVVGTTGPSIAWNMSGGGFYDFAARWWGPTSADGSVHCFLDRFSGGAIVSSWRGSLALTLATGGAFANREVSLTAAPLATVTGTVTDPLGEASVTIAVGPAVANGSGYFASDGPQAPGAFSRVVPYAPGDFLAVVAADATMSRRSMTLVPAAASVAVDLSLLPRPTLLAPASGASSVVPTSPIVFQGGEGHAFLVVLWTKDGTAIRIYTTSPTVVPPDLARFGLAYPAGGAAYVLVAEFDAPTVDALADDTGRVRFIAQRGTMRSAQTPVHAFTFAN